MRVPPVTDRDALDAEGRAAFDRIVETRGELLRPFQLLLHAPSMAARVAELGHVVRTASHLSDRDRELATITTGAAHGCRFVWESHLTAAAGAGIDRGTIDAIVAGRYPADPQDARTVAFVREVTTGTLTDDAFASMHQLLGDRGVVELSLTVGYYAMLASVMTACDAC